MVEENQICPSCQAVIRSRALFCYKCGASIVSNSSAKSKKGGRRKTAELIEQALKKEEISNIWFKDNIVQGSGNDPKTTEVMAETADEFTTATTSDEIPSPETSTEVKIESSPSIQEKAKLESAASMRQKAKTINKKQIEVVWEQTNSSNIWFMLGTIIFATIAFAIVFLAWMLR
jgi:hypothetical protein